MPRSKAAKQRQRNNEQQQSSFVAEQLKQHLFGNTGEEDYSSDDNSGDENYNTYDNDVAVAPGQRDYRPAVASKSKTQSAESKAVHAKISDESYVPTSSSKKQQQINPNDQEDEDDYDEDEDIRRHTAAGAHIRHDELGVGGGIGGGGGGKAGKNALVGASAADAASGAGGTVAGNASREKDRSERATVETVMDPRTRLILHKMVNSGILDRVHGCVSTGKEANVYLGILGEAGPGIWENTQQQIEAASEGSAKSGGKDSVHFHPQQYTANKKKQQQQNKKGASTAKTQPQQQQKTTSEGEAPALIPTEQQQQQQPDHPFQPSSYIALKIYKTSILVFKDREKYVAGEYRFQRYCKSNPRKMVRTWAEKESRNLNRLYNGGVPCPRVFLLRQHILAMEFIGTEGWPAPRLKDVRLSPSAFEKCYHQIVVGMRKMFQDCRLVHGDLSEFNLLVFNGKVIFIDVSQSVEHDHPHSMDFLRRDIVNVHVFFKSRGVTSCMSHRELFEFITTPHDVAAWAKEPEAWIKSQTEIWRDRNEGNIASTTNEDGTPKLHVDSKKEDEVFLQVPVPRDLRGDAVQKSLANPDVAPLMRAMLGVQGLTSALNNNNNDEEDDEEEESDDDEEESDVEEAEENNNSDKKKSSNERIKTVKLVVQSDDEDDEQQEQGGSQDQLAKMRALMGFGGLNTAGANDDDDDDDDEDDKSDDDEEEGDNYLSRYDAWCQTDDTLKAASVETLAKVRNFLIEHSKGHAKLALMSKDEKKLFQHAIKLEQRKKRTEKVPKHIKRRATKKHMKK